MFNDLEPGKNLINRILGKLSPMNLKFANGATTGAMVHLLNHEGAHLVSREVKINGVGTGSQHAAVSVDLNAAEAAEINTFLIKNGYPRLNQDRISFSSIQENGNLVGKINHPADLLGSMDPKSLGIQFEQNLSFNSGVSKVDFAKSAITGTTNFNNHGIDYSFAAVGDMNFVLGSYNSNSYALGLTAHSGGSITTTNGLIHRFPGITRVVPHKYFAKPRP